MGLLTSSEWRPEVLINILECTGQLPATNKEQAQNNNRKLKNSLDFIMLY